MIHENCIKMWIKVWIQSKIISYRNGELQPHNQRRQAPILGALENQQHNLGHQNRSSDKIKPLNFKNLKQKQYYPFPCQICRYPIYFDIFFRYRLKTSSELSYKDLVLFALPLFFTVIFLGICINWMLQTGVNLYLILFYSLVWMPLFVITVAIGIVTFSKKQFWVKGIYSRSEIAKRNSAELEETRKLKKENNQNSLKNQQYQAMKKKLEQIRGKYLNKAKNQREVNIAQNQDPRIENENPQINRMKLENANHEDFPNQRLEQKEKQQSQCQEIQLEIEQELPGTSTATLHKEADEVK